MCFVSFVIPTTGRAEYLRHTLASIVRQSDSDFEVIVSDNQSQDDTKDVVEEFASHNVKYVKTSSRINMCDSWDFAVEHASGKFVIVIGDDDGVMSFAVETLKHQWETNPADIYYWSEHTYFWPDVYGKPFCEKVSQRSQPRTMNVNQRVRSVIKRGSASLKQIPMIYHGAVSSALLDKIRAEQGRLFHSRQPDTYLGFVCAAYSPICVNVGRALSVNAWSAASNSGSMRIQYNSDTNLEYATQFEETGHPTLVYDDRLQFFNASPESVLMAMDRFSGYYGDVEFNHSAMYALFCKLAGFQNVIWVFRNARKISKACRFSVVKMVVLYTAMMLISFSKAFSSIAPNLKLRGHRNSMSVADFIELLEAKKLGGNV